jgi:hypothetical protein
MIKPNSYPVSYFSIEIVLMARRGRSSESSYSYHELFVNAEQGPLSSSWAQASSFLSFATLRPGFPARLSIGIWAYTELRNRVDSAPFIFGDRFIIFPFGRKDLRGKQDIREYALDFEKSIKYSAKSRLKIPAKVWL